MKPVRFVVSRCHTGVYKSHPCCILCEKVPGFTRYQRVDAAHVTGTPVIHRFAHRQMTVSRTASTRGGGASRAMHPTRPSEETNCGARAMCRSRQPACRCRAATYRFFAFSSVDFLSLASNPSAQRRNRFAVSGYISSHSVARRRKSATQLLSVQPSGGASISLTA